MPKRFSRWCADTFAPPRKKDYRKVSDYVVNTWDYSQDNLVIPSPDKLVSSDKESDAEEANWLYDYDEDTEGQDPSDSVEACGMEEQSSVQQYRHHSPTIKTYVYCPLVASKEMVRLLKVQPSQFGRPEVSLETFNVTDAPPFAALSYTWGAPSPTYIILVDGATLFVRKNLFVFLQQYREIRCLWIDQICIDQFDVSERNHQAALMRSIFT